jgi:hypothetical protein
MHKLKTLTFCPYKINFLSSNTIKANSLIYDTHPLENIRTMVGHQLMVRVHMPLLLVTAIKI